MAYDKDADEKNFACHGACCVSWHVAWLLICSELIVYLHWCFYWFHWWAFMKAVKNLWVS
jgi:hypothetical protein